MSAADVLTINTDGGARGNPGPAAYAYVIQRDGEPAVEEAGCLGRATNNQAEYTALVRALEHAARLGTHHRLHVRSDSELLVRQMNGQYRVKDAQLRPLYEEARRLCALFPAVTIRHVPREQNAWADRLCNEALDGKRLPSPTPAEVRKRAAKAPPAEEAARAEALACLEEAAARWADADPKAPAAEAVWDRLCGILRRHGLLRQGRAAKGSAEQAED
ncbi:MAG TPA: ribonuclease HI family protein [Gemmataceae bacterium]|nr:ribonuclease HI family protein [Gemmataceae bacterium]